tara:strand:+ start:877 stop:1080 length:204 start_codon:yes stop_codon:yes gene_type:complete
MSNQTTSEVLHIRVQRTDLHDFRSVCRLEFNLDPNDVIRDLLRAFADGRIKITPTEAQLKFNTEVQS